MQRLNPRSRSDAYGRRINRDHSPIRATVVPWLSVLVASLFQILPVATALPILPPLAFMVLLGWRLSRPGLFPVWAGFPLGLFDDLFSGQPFGSAIMLWSLAMLVIEIIETRMPWRSFLLDWGIASAMLVAYLATGAIFSGARIDAPLFIAMVPQVILAIVLMPAVSGLISWLDRVRLQRVRVSR